jgi:hypothetical protein
MSEEPQKPIREIAKRIVAEAVEVSFMRGVEVERERLLSDPELYRRLRESWLAHRMG